MLSSVYIRIFIEKYAPRLPPPEYTLIVSHTSTERTIRFREHFFIFEFLHIAITVAELE